MADLDEYKGLLETIPQDPEVMALINKGFEEIEKVKAGEEITPEVTEEEPETSEAQEASAEEVSDEFEEETEEEEHPRKERKIDKYRKLQNDKYRALAEKAKAEARAAELEAMLNESLNSSTYHYGKSVYGELERAQDNKAKALESGDYEAFKKADVELIQAVYNVRELEKWEAQEKVKTNRSPSPEYDDSQVKQEMALDWLDSHPYLKPNTRSYDAKLYSQVNEFVNYLNEDLQSRGQADIYATPEYFDIIDSYINDIRAKRPSTVSNNVSSLPPVGGVRSTYTTAPKPKTPSVQLTADEKKMCANMGLSEADWLKLKIEETKKQRNR